MFLVVKTAKDITNHLLNIEKLFSQQPMPQSALFYKNKFIRAKALIFAQKNREQAKNEGRRTVVQNIRKKCLGEPFFK